jgi:hypothetical protein
VGRDNRNVECLAEPSGDTPLGLRVGVGVKQGDCHTLDCRVDRLLAEPVDERRDRGVVRLPLDTVDRRALVEFVPSVGRDQRLRPVGVEVVQGGPVLSPDLEDVPEPLGGDERRLRARVLQESVRRYRRPVSEPLDRRGVDICPLTDALNPREHPHTLVVGRRQLCRRHSSVCDEHDVGERPADVDPEHRAALAHTRRWWSRRFNAPPPTVGGVWKPAGRSVPGFKGFFIPDTLCTAWTTNSSTATG